MQNVSPGVSFIIIVVVIFLSAALSVKEMNTHL